MRQSKIPFYTPRAGVFNLSVINSQGATQLAREGADQPITAMSPVVPGHVRWRTSSHTAPPTLTVSVSSPVVPASNPWCQDGKVPASYPFCPL